MHYKFTTHRATHIHTIEKEKPSQYSAWELMAKFMLTYQVINLGYKSVAHYLIQTRRSQPKSETSGAEESVQDDMKQETEDGQVAGEEEMEEVQPVAAKDMGNIHDNGSGVAGDSVEGETKEKSRRRNTRLRKN